MEKLRTVCVFACLILMAAPAWTGEEDRPREALLRVHRYAVAMADGLDLRRVRNGRTADEWLEDLFGRDEDKAREARIEVLRWEQDAVRGVALYLSPVGQQGEHNDRALELLHELLPTKREEFERRFKARSTLVRVAALHLIIPMADRASVPALIEAAPDPSKDVRALVATALGHIGSTAGLPALVALAQDGEIAVRYSAILALARSGPEGVVEAEKTLLPPAGRKFGKELEHLFFEPPGAAVSLARLLSAKSRHVRSWAAHRLGLLRTMPPALEPVLAQALNDESARVQLCSAWALYRLPSIQAESAANLRRLLDHEDAQVQLACALCLARHGHGGASVLTIAVDAMRRAQPPSFSMRFLLPAATLQAGHEVTEVMLGYPPTAQRIAAELARLGDPARSKLHELLGDKDVVLRRNAVLGLVHMGESAAGELRRALSDGDATVRRRAALGLAAQGVADEAVLDILIKQLAWTGQSGDSDRITRLVEALIELGPSSIPLLGEALLSDSFDDVCESLCEVFEAWGGRAAPAVPYLLQANLDDRIGQIGQAKVRDNYLAHLVRSIGEPARPYLVRALEDEDEDVRTTAKLALGYLPAKNAK